MPSLHESAGLLAVILIFGVALAYAVGDVMWGRWIRRRGQTPFGRPEVYQRLAAEAQERQMRTEHLARSVDTTLAEAMDRVGGFYDTSPLTADPVDRWGEGLLEETVRTHTLHPR